MCVCKREEGEESLGGGEGREIERERERERERDEEEEGRRGGDERRKAE